MGGEEGRVKGGKVVLRDHLNCLAITGSVQFLDNKSVFIHVGHLQGDIYTHTNWYIRLP